MSERGIILDDFLTGGPMTSVDIVDCHVHMGLALYQQVPDAEGDDVVKRMDAMGLSKACVSHSAAMVSDWYLGNSLLMETVAKHPDRFFGYAVFNPRYPDQMDAEMERCTRGGLHGLKIHPDFHQMPADSRLYDPVYARGAAENRIILCHYGSGKSPLSGSHLYKSVVDRHPSAWYIMAHSLPNRDAVDTAVELFGGRDNVLFDLANAFPTGVIEYAVRRLGAGRLLYGSDGVWGSVATRLGMVVCTDLPDDTKQRLLGGNMRALLASSA
jgi:uncharacterized protein